MRAYVPLLRSVQWVKVASEQVNCEALDIDYWIKGRDQFDPAFLSPRPKIRPLCFTPFSPDF